MKKLFCFLLGLCLLVASCKNDDDDAEDNIVPSRTIFTFKLQNTDDEVWIVLRDNDRAN